MITESYAQDIEVGPVRVDTGNDWMDLGFAALLLVIVVACVMAMKRRR